MKNRHWTSLLLVLGCGFAAGCGSSTPASFRQRESIDTLMEGVYSKEDKGRIGNAREAVSSTVEKFFGTPSNLVAWERLPIDYTTMTEPDVDAEGEAAEATPVGEEGDRLATGRGLYMEHCMHCHGVTGDGNGPTAKYFNHPKPRDYRLGTFKFTSTKGQFRARRADLERIIREGIPGTYMPSFLLLDDEEMHAIVEYVRWLACRGEMEKQLIDSIGSQYGYTAEKLERAVHTEDMEEAFEIAFDKEADKKAHKAGKVLLAREFEKFLNGEGDEAGNGTMTELVDAIGDVLAENWSAQEQPEAYIVPSVPRTEPTPESIANGRTLFLGAKAKCVNCHGRAGKGDGPQTLAFQTDPDTKAEYPEPGLYDVWGNPIEPRNLTLGLYRGGRRPIDLFRRIHSGVKGTPMTGFSGPLSDAEIWDVVNYVMSIPFEDGTPPAASTPSTATAAGEPQTPGDDS